MRNVLWIIRGLLCLAGGIFCIVMTIMALRFMEYGRTIFYLIIGIFCVEATVVSLMKTRNSQS